ncbi:Gfo/Idh/MocA family protein [Salinisphaera hydrothermalis]|uniref:Oxidoreductase domain-containing protein n=1 Tax=Salinisphaera hydrothermalis (strain C41B8) TaxID=1304275 RepID=A0A084IMK0_SALHC|nr:Gfo/Idh/MocA family oxidoreductase [Salinisphaera hydrothermalis]KEZ77934.1 oxidoreductase domain-containing protein [Salinisphaera hydrothermalis C41B8]
MDKQRIGIFGAGYIASVHTDILGQDDRVELVGVADMVEANAARLAASIGNARTGTTLDDLFRLDVDTVYITTPNTTHVDPVVACLNEGRNVFCEKPMATDLDGGDHIREAAQASSGVYNLGMNRRYAWTHAKLKSLIDAGDLAPYSAQLKLNRGELLRPAWTADPTKTGGFLYETTIHQIDLLQYLFGPIATLRCAARSAISNAEFDDFSMLFTFESGTVATLSSSAHSGWSFPFERIEIYGRYATAMTEELERVRYALDLDQTVHTEDYTHIAFAEKGGYAKEDRLFIDALVDGGRPPVGIDDAYALNLLLAAIYESARENKEIDFAERVRTAIG